VPTSIGGKIAGSIVALASVLVRGFPVTVINQRFSKLYRFVRAKNLLPKHKNRVVFNNRHIPNNKKKQQEQSATMPINNNLTNSASVPKSNRITNSASKPGRFTAKIQHKLI
jgi:hypothetical protein